MNVICLLESVSRTDGGIFEAECALQRELSQNQGMRVDVVGLEDQYTEEDRTRWLPIVPKSVKPKGLSALGYAPDLLYSLDPKADLLYAATLWKYPSWAALRWAEQTGKPMIVAPHGSLDEWALRNAAWKKRIAANLFKDRQLHKAACLRALCQAEAEAFSVYGLKNPVAIIPNGIDLPEEVLAKPKTGGKKKLLFLGRVHPKKGLSNALRAFAKVLDVSSWQIVIAGWDQGGHEAELIKLCEELGLSNKKLNEKSENMGVKWPDQPKLKLENAKYKNEAGTEPDADVVFYGPAFGEDKKALLSTADAFILPSFSEGLPMSVLEAWSYKLPVIMTPECNLPEGFAAEAAICIEVEVTSIIQGMNALFSMSDGDLRLMGKMGYELVKERFTWKIIARQMREVYDWVLGGGAPPECVIKG